MVEYCQFQLVQHTHGHITLLYLPVILYGFIIAYYELWIVLLLIYWLIIFSSPDVYLEGNDLDSSF